MIIKMIVASTIALARLVGIILGFLAIVGLVYGTSVLIVEVLNFGDMLSVTIIVAFLGSCAFFAIYDAVKEVYKKEKEKDNEKL